MVKRWVFSLALNAARKSLSRTDMGREFHVDSAAQLKDLLPKDVFF